MTWFSTWLHRTVLLTEVHPLKNRYRLLGGPKVLVELLDKLAYAIIDEALRLGDVGHGIHPGNGSLERRVSLCVLAGDETGVVNSL